MYLLYAIGLRKLLASFPQLQFTSLVLLILLYFSFCGDPETAYRLLQMDIYGISAAHGAALVEQILVL